MRVAQLARAMGVRESKLDVVPSLALGTSPVTLKEMVAAYGAIASAGSYRAPRVITRIEDKGLQISRIRLFQMDDAFAQDFYAEHCGKAYFPRLCRFMTSGPVVALEVQSPGAVLLVRAMIGATQPEDRLPGSIRGDFATDVTENIVHASSSLSDAERELRLVFGEGKSSGRD